MTILNNKARGLNLKYHFRKFVFRSILILVVCSFAVSCSHTNKNDTQKRAQIQFNKTPHERAQIQFNKTRHDFGTVAFNTKVSHGFNFSNPGKQKLMIRNINTSCGCTVAQWSKKPTDKGEKEEIHIVFDADHPGTFQKSITVYYNGKNSPDTLCITGETKRPENKN